MDRHPVEAVLANPTALVLIALAAPWVAMGGIALYALRTRGNGHGKGSGRVNGADSELSLSGLYGAMEAVKVMVQQVLNRVHDLEAMISGLREENRAKAESDARLRERVAAIEGAQGHDGRPR